jgi:hypothetical protein
MIIVYSRCTEDWSNFSYEELLYISKKKSGSFLDEKLALDLVRKMKRWDNLCDVSYFKYRSMLKSLSLRTWMNYKVCDSMEELFDSVSDDDFVCPSDDDDWYRQNLSEKIPEHIGNSDFLLWDQMAYMVGGVPHLWSEYHGDVVGSNNYCITGSAFRSMNKKDLMLLLNSHARADHICEKAGLNKRKTKYLMSCYLWHIGSASYMMSEYYHRQYEKIEERILPPEMSWAQDYFSEYVKIHNSLNPQKKVKYL